jgi:hypothetical protein
VFDQFGSCVLQNTNQVLAVVVARETALTLNPGKHIVQMTE